MKCKAIKNFTAKSGKVYSVGDKIKKEDISARLLRGRKIQEVQPVKRDKKIQEDVPEVQEELLTEMSSDIEIIQEIIEDGIIDDDEKEVLSKISEK